MASGCSSDNAAVSVQKIDIMATKDDILNMDCVELRDYLKTKFNFSEATLQQFTGVYCGITCLC